MRILNVRFFFLGLLCFSGAYTVYFSNENLFYFFALLFYLLLSAPRLNFSRISIGGGGFVIFLLLMAGWLIFSKTWALSEANWRNDAVLLLFLCFVALISLISVRHDEAGMLCLGLVVAGLLTGSLIIADMLFSISLMEGRVSVRENYLSLASPVAVAFIISVIHVLYANNLRLLWLTISIYLLVALAFSLARGALIFTVFLLITMPFLQLCIAKRISFYIFKNIVRLYWAFIIPLVGGVVYISLNVERTFDRMKRLLTPAQELAQGGRGELWGNSIEAIREAPILGYGLGSSGIKSSGQEDNHPHNFLLQVWLDGGVIALLLTLIVTCIPIFFLIRFIRLNTFDVYGLSFLLIYSFVILDFLKSYNFYTSRSLVIIGVVSIVYTASKSYSKAPSAVT